MTQSNGQQLEEVKGYVDQGLIKPVIDKVFSFEDYQEAFKYLMSGRTKGKIILKIKE